MYHLILFDAVDLLDNKGEVLLEAKAYFARLRLAGWPQAALITNQGGPACRDADWSWSAKYPTLAEVEAQYGRLAETLGARLYMSLIYLTRQGQVYRPSALAADDPRGRPDWRLPGGGMIRQAMQDHQIERPDEVLVVATRPEALLAAQAVKAAYFANTRNFFRTIRPPLVRPTERAARV